MSFWPEVINHELRVELVKAGPEKYQNREDPFASSHRTVKVGDSNKLERKSFSENWFYKTLKNGDKILRRWLLYSKKESGLYCFCCKLFHSAGNDLFVTKCFNNFWHLNPRIFEHENSKIHKECIEKWKELAMRLKLQQTIDKNMQKQIDQERKKRKAILEIVVDVILFLSKQNLPFRGHREAFESNNQGNFLETVKLLVKYSLVLSKHLTDTRTSKKMITTYLSPTNQNELILLLSDKVKNITVEEAREVKYFAIMCDSTPDISHTDQMALIVRYVTIQNGIAQVKESFMNFFPLRGKTAAEISRSILDELEVNNLDVMMCRGQRYDNASTMSGIHSGVQQTIKNINQKPLFVPCGNHTLNLAGVHAVGLSQLSERFFAVLERLYAFFAASPYRWGVLLKHAPITLNG